MSSAPDAALARAPDWGGAWRSCTTTAVTPKAAAVRRMAPTLWGSDIWSSTSTMRRFRAGLFQHFVQVAGLEGLGFQRRALVHRAGRQQPVDGAGFHGFRPAPGPAGPRRWSRWPRGVRQARPSLRSGLARAAWTACRP